MSVAQTTVLNIAHFNDVYQVSNQKVRIDNQEENIDVTKFATLLTDITATWKDGTIDCPKNQESLAVGHQKDGLVVFSGDLFSPSTESSITRGRHMPTIMNGLCVDVGITGNHEFDFGYPRLQELIKDTTFPWLLSNIIDTNTGKVPEPMKEMCVLDRAGLRIGFIGLVEKDWIATITGWPKNFEYQDMATVGKNLSAKLRDPAGQYKCDFLIALTHSRIPNDIKLAKALFALSPAAQENKNIASEQGVDLLLGGHDHIYWISKGVTDWDGYDTEKAPPDAVDDQGDVLVVKSGTDFQDLSEIVLTLVDTAAGSIRKKVIQDIRGKRHITRGHTAVNQNLKEIVDSELGTINAALKEPICMTETRLDVRSSYIRCQESPIANWIADCLRHAYDEALVKLGYGKADGVIACTGDFRGDRVYEPGPITLGDLTAILPYLDPTVVVELDGNSLWDALESALSRWPTQEGRFPAISGLRVSWDSKKPGGQRLCGLWLQAESQKMGADGRPLLVDKEQILRGSTKKYLIVVGEYMVQGGDGYTALKGGKLVIPAENGQSKSALIRQFLLGAQFLNKKVREDSGSRNGLQSTTLEIIGGAESQLRQWQQLLRLPQASSPSLPSVPSFSRRSFPSVPGSLTNIHNSLPGLGRGSKFPNIPNNLPGFGRGGFPNIQNNLPGFGRGSFPNIHDSLTNMHNDAHNFVQATAQGAVDSMTPVIKWLTSPWLFSVALIVAVLEDMGFLDPYERQRYRRRRAGLLHVTDVQANFAFFAASEKEEEAKVNAAEEDAKGSLPIIRPLIDGRLKDVAQG